MPISSKERKGPDVKPIVGSRGLRCGGNGQSERRRGNTEAKADVSSQQQKLTTNRQSLTGDYQPFPSDPE